MFDFMNDPRWTLEDPITKKRMIKASFEDTVASDERWADELPNDQEAMKSAYLDEAAKYDESKTVPEEEGFLGGLLSAGKGIARDVAGIGGIQDYDKEELPEPTGPKLGFMDKWKEIKEEGVIPFVPFISGAKEVYDIAKIAKSKYKLDAGTATQEEKDQLISFVQEANKDTDFWYKTLDVVSAMPTFMGEFLLTGGIYSAGRKVGTKVAIKSIKSFLGESGEKLLKKKIGKIGVGIAGGVAGATIQAPIMGAPRIISGTIERSMPELRLTEDEKGNLDVLIAGKGENLLPAFTKALGDQWAETVSEHSGGLFGIMGRSAKNVAIKTGLFSAFMKANKGIKPSKAISYFRKIGYHGVINEMMEERLGEGLRAGIGVQEYKLPTAEQLGVSWFLFLSLGLLNKLG